MPDCWARRGWRLQVDLLKSIDGSVSDADLTAFDTGAQVRFLNRVLNVNFNLEMEHECANLIHTWLQPGGHSARLAGNRLNGFPVHCPSQNTWFKPGVNETETQMPFHVPDYYKFHFKAEST